MVNITVKPATAEQLASEMDMYLHTNVNELLNMMKWMTDNVDPKVMGDAIVLFLKKNGQL